MRGLRFILILLAAMGAPASAQASAQTAWTPVNAFDGAYHLSIPCSEADVAAWRSSVPTEIGSNGAGCQKPDYTVMILFAKNAPPTFFDGLVAKSQHDRVPPNVWAGHRILRTVDAPKKGVGEVTLQFVEVDKSRFLMILFEAKPAATAQSRALVDQLLNSLVLKPQ